MIFSRRHFAFLLGSEEQAEARAADPRCGRAPPGYRLRWSLTARDAALLPPLPLGNPVWLQGMSLGLEFHQTHRKHCGALFISFFQIGSWRSHCTSAAWGGWAMAPASPGSSRMRLPCPVGHVVVPETVPYLRPRVLPLVGFLQVRDP